MAQVAKTDQEREALRLSSVNSLFEAQRLLGMGELARARAAETRETTEPTVDVLEAQAEGLRSTAGLRSAQQEALQELTPANVRKMEADADYAEKQVQEYFPFRYKDEEFQVLGRSLLASLGRNTGMTQADKLAILKYNNETGAARGMTEPVLIGSPGSDRAISEYQNWNRTASSPYAYILNEKGNKVEPVLLPPVKIGGQWTRLTAQEFQMGAEAAVMAPRRFMEHLQANYGTGGDLTTQERNFDLLGE